MIAGLLDPAWASVPAAAESAHVRRTLRVGAAGHREAAVVVAAAAGAALTVGAAADVGPGAVLHLAKAAARRAQGLHEVDVVVAQAWLLAEIAVE